MRSGKPVVAVARKPEPSAVPMHKTVKANSLAWLCHQYTSSTRFQSMDRQTASAGRRYLDRICASKDIATGRPRGNLDIQQMKPTDIEAIKQTIDMQPVALSFALTRLNACFNWAMKLGLLAVNPCASVDMSRPKSSGFHTWTRSEMTIYEKAYPLGTLERLAYEIMKWTAVRQSDAIRLGPQHIRDGKLYFTEYKNGHSKVMKSSPKARVIEVVPELVQAIKAMPAAKQKSMLFLMTPTRNRPFNVKSFTRWFRTVCDDIGLKDCTSHGIRKGVLTVAAEEGATGHELMAMAGHTNLQQTEVYTKAAQQTKMASSGIAKLRKATAS